MTKQSYAKPQSTHSLIDAVDGELPGLGVEGVEVVGGNVTHDVPRHRRVIKVLPPAGRKREEEGRRRRRRSCQDKYLSTDN